MQRNGRAQGRKVKALNLCARAAGRMTTRGRGSHASLSELSATLTVLRATAAMLQLHIMGHALASTDDELNV